MFSQRKTYWKRPLFLLFLLALIGGGYWFIQGNNPTENDEIGQELPIQIVDANTNRNNGEGKVSYKDQGGDSVEENQSPYTENNGLEKFFLVKKTDNSIDVYFYNGVGEPSFIKNTGIEFSLLSKEDQAKFIEGIILETEDELNELLQDFGS